MKNGSNPYSWPYPTPRRVLTLTDPRSGHFFKTGTNRTPDPIRPTRRGADPKLTNEAGNFYWKTGRQGPCRPADRADVVLTHTAEWQKSSSCLMKVINELVSHWSCNLFILSLYRKTTDNVDIHATSTQPGLMSTWEERLHALNGTLGGNWTSYTVTQWRL